MTADQKELKRFTEKLDARIEQEKAWLDSQIRGEDFVGAGKTSTIKTTLEETNRELKAMLESLQR